MTRNPDITVDSGAGKIVANPKHFPNWRVTESEGSRRGQMFRPASGKLIPNKGQITPKMLTENGGAGSVNFQAADVEQPLLFASDVNRKGNPI